MSLAMDTGRNMFFVGGNDYKSNNPTGNQDSHGMGGCTKAWWDAEVANTDAETAMGKLMGADGEAIYNLPTLDIVYQSSAGGKIQIQNNLMGGFEGVEAGMLMYFMDPSSAVGSGIYEVIELVLCHS